MTVAVEFVGNTPKQRTHPMEVDVTLRFPEAQKRHSGPCSRTAALLKITVLALMLAAAAALAACSANTPGQTAPTATTAATQPAAEATTPAAAEPAPASTAKLEIKDLKVGKGLEAKSGDAVTVDYTGWLMDGTKFDSSIGKAPFPFTIGAGEVIPGWDQGVAGMKVGGKRQLVIPSDLAYGDAGYPPVIPGGATLKFDVTLLLVNGKK